ncbi:MAG TPA: purine-binding chemotaxis protein CheW [Desulfobacteraceae bacterium]|nr:purine-binding chemotaxis protein CheW [Desulfobacteraceae bacterium]
MDQPYTNERDDQSEEEKLLQLVGFTIGKEQFGVDILMVQEIIRKAPITSIPDSPGFIEGVINLRGNIIPVIDLRKRLNLFHSKNQNDGSWIIILNIEKRVTGFIVDSVTEVLKIRKDTIKPPPDIVVAGLKSQYISGVCKLDKGLLILLNFNRILLVEEIKKLKEIERSKRAVNA